MTGSAPLSPLRTRGSQILAYSPSEFGDHLGAASRHVGGYLGAGARLASLGAHGASPGWRPVVRLPGVPSTVELGLCLAGCGVGGLARLRPRRSDRPVVISSTIDSVS